jgi:uncharacterized FAD-dependent dehydrogenase
LIRLNDIKVSVDYTDDEIKEVVSNRLKIRPADIKSLDVVRQSIDARYNNVRFSLGLMVEAKGFEDRLDSNIIDLPDFKNTDIKLEERPVIIGAGPAGMFAALVLSEAGCRPILVERGQPIEERRKQIINFQNTGQLNAESNVCFGEGGAGTYSDGKLVTRVNDPLCSYILKTFVEHGADSKILIDAKPHIGTDILSEILIKMRKKIISLGGEVAFNEKMVDMQIGNNVIKSIKTTKRDIPCQNVILATGHGARDVYELIDTKNIVVEAKGFALGVRIEHPREMIDKAIYGQHAGHERLGAAMYNLKGKFAGRNVYTFCMCPGGEVVNASTEPDGLCVNGMSYNARDGVNSNAAVVVQIQPEEWGNAPMGGIERQRRLERLAFSAAGGDFGAPVQRFGDFLDGAITKSFGYVKPSIKGKTAMVNLNNILGEDISAGIKGAVTYWDRIIKGYSMNEAVLTGVEGRTSSPVRIKRGDNLQSPSVRGLYPCGEGAGYAGGIMSAAIDGIKCALGIIDIDE